MDSREHSVLETILREKGFMKDLFDIVPFPMFIVDSDVNILYWNFAANALLGEEQILKRRAGEVLHCIHSGDHPEGCGRGSHCRNCVIRNSVNLAFGGHKVQRQRVVMELVTPLGTKELPLLVTTAPFAYDSELYSLLILEDISELLELKGMIPICAWCKRVRDDKDYWQSVEAYVSKHIVDVGFTHGICPDCVTKLSPAKAKKE